MELTAEFTKKGEMKYISHLDLLRLFQRASRRAGLKLALTQGYNPHFKISIDKALKLGLESDSEKIKFSVAGDIQPLHFIDRMNNELPEGIKLKNAEKL